MIIQQGYEISAVDSFQFDKRQSEEFLEVYKGVIPEFTDQAVQLCSGVSVCMELRAENAVEVHPALPYTSNFSHILGNI